MKTEGSTRFVPGTEFCFSKTKQTFHAKNAEKKD